MPFIDQVDLDTLKQQSAELAALQAAASDDDPMTSIAARENGPGRNALLSAIQKTRMPMILTNPHQPDNPIIFANRAFVELSGYSQNELIGRNCRFLQGKETLPGTVKKIREAVEDRVPVTIDIVNYRKNGERFVNELYISPIFSPTGKLLYFFGSQVDVTAYVETRLSVQLTLIERERHVLAQIAKGVPLSQVLSDLLLVIEEQYDPGTRTSILFISDDGRKLRHGAAPSLPADYNEAIDGIAIGEGIGSCGTVAFRGEPVYTNDIETDRSWADFRALALAHGLRACWSTPIKATDGTVLGTFAVYCDVPRSPTNQEIAAIGFVTQTAALAIERHRHEKEMRRSEEKLHALNTDLERTIQEVTTERDLARINAERVQNALSAGAIVGTWFWDLPSDRFTVDDAFATAFGLDPALGHEGIPLAQIVATVHPDDQAGLATAIDEAIGRGGRYAHQYRVRRRDGRYHWLEANGHVEHARDGTPLRFPGVLIDVGARRSEAALGLLSERLRTFKSPEDMVGAAAETVGATLGLTRAAYGSVDATRQLNIIAKDWLAEGQRSIIGRHSFEYYGSFVEDLMRGENVLIADARTDSRTRDHADGLKAFNIVALANLPLLERGQLKVVFCLHTSEPHVWTDDEVAFARRVMDRTETEISRRAAENALRASEERLRLVVEGASDHAIVTTDPDGIITSWSAGAQDIFEWSVEESMGQSIEMIFTPEDQVAGVPSQEIETAKTRGAASDARWHITKHGRRVYMNGSVHPLRRDGEKQDHGFIKIARDETSRQQAEVRRTALLKLGDRLSDLTEPEAMTLAACEILGTLLGVHLVGYGDVDPEAESITVIQDWTAGDTPSLAGTVYFRDFGCYIDDLKRDQTVIVNDSRTDPRTSGHSTALEERAARAFVNAPVFEQGRFVALLYVSTSEPRPWDEAELAFIREVAERIRGAAARLAAEERQRAATDELRQFAQTLEARVAERTADRNSLWLLSSDIMLRCTFEGTMTAVNPAWTELLGWREDELVGSNLFDLIHPDDLAHTAEGASELSRGIAHARFDNRYRHRDGSYRWISWSTQPAEGLINAVGRDITEERGKTEALAKAEEIVRQAQKMEAVGQLTGGVAHDFNNLLTIIRASVDLLKRPNLRPDQRDRYLQAVSDTVDRASKLTGQLLAFARRQALKPEVFDVGARLRGVGEMLDTVTGARIRVAIHVPQNKSYVRADISQFETALVNMAVNARDAMSGEGQLTLSLEGGIPLPTIRGHAGSNAAFAAVSVTDSGSGIAPDQLSKIFEPFFTTKEVGKGTGLGLSQVFGFVKQSGGDVDVRSTVGEGTTFTLYLPEVSVAEVERSPDDSEHSAAAASGQRILVVEDNVDVGRFCTQILDDLGYVTTWAANAEEALEKIGNNGGDFEAVFSDVVMPGMGGVALAETLRERLPHLPVVLASGYSHVLARDADHGFELLHKPYSADQLARVLQRVMSKASGTRRSEVAL